MDHDEPGSKKTDPKRRDFLVLSLCCIAACAIVRAPSVLDEITVPLIDLKLKLNAGYLLVFGPLLIVLAILAIHFLREDTPHTRGKKDLKNGLFRAIPPLGAAFLSLQFLLLLAPKGECDSFQRSRLLLEWLPAFKPEYCMYLPAETQEHMPWLFEPPMLQAWMQILLPMVALAVVIKDWRTLAG
ncbi:hypothetical protein [Bradyrhizobium sp. SZCCHNRI3052]|uniref:hypothetical protein n=1 Tax=Bradyrhizobium sp. SZCCHNRI3052 TaxID=3057295 RepID=UPI0029168F0E|nr:hypothetical protein [Bradyrhizobium sp. SZCCHNRI3052]